MLTNLIINTAHREPQRNLRAAEGKPKSYLQFLILCDTPWPGLVLNFLKH